jgi:hypothetical protein
MDTSHLFLGAAYFNFEPTEYVSTLQSLSRWFHISAASGVDGEGNNFSEASKSQQKLLLEIVQSPKIKVIEVWQGHLNNFEGFCRAIIDLKKLVNLDEIN